MSPLARSAAAQAFRILQSVLRMHAIIDLHLRKPNPYNAAESPGSPQIVGGSPRILNPCEDTFVQPTQLLPFGVSSWMGYSLAFPKQFGFVVSRSEGLGFRVWFEALEFGILGMNVQG